jgi:hypothetical protein
MFDWCPVCEVHTRIAAVILNERGDEIAELVELHILIAGQLQHLDGDLRKRGQTKMSPRQLLGLVASLSRLHHCSPSTCVLRNAARRTHLDTRGYRLVSAKEWGGGRGFSWKESEGRIRDSDWAAMPKRG